MITFTFTRYYGATATKGRNQAKQGACLGISRNIFQRVIYFGIIFIARRLRNATIDYRCT